MNIEDTVMVIEPGSTYTTYAEMAKHMKLSNWNPTELPEENRIYKIITIAKHGDDDSSWVYTYNYDLRPTLAGIQDIETGKQYIVNIDALERTYMFSFPSEDFTL